MRRARPADAVVKASLLGVVLASTNRTAEAIDAWRRALALDPSDQNAAFNLKRVGGRH